jgi:NADP-dependent 3-hydroxy acid dehydrogenase YdfG
VTAFVGSPRTFENVIAVVTGAGGGIGAAIARALAAERATLWLIGRSQRTLEATATTCRAAAAHVHLACVDLVRDEAIKKLAGELREEAGRVDVLVHCAGQIVLGPLATASIDDLDRLYRINVRAPYLLTQALLPLLRVCEGEVVFLNSSAGVAAPTNLSQYSATKFALRAVADALRQEVNADGIRVVSVFPGRTASPMQAAVHAAEGKDYRPERLMQADDVAAAVLAALRLPRTAEVTDIHVRPMRKPA